MEYIGPFIFNAIRFALGTSVLIPLLLKNRKVNITKNKSPKIAIGYILAGIVLFIAVSLQQVGIVYTSAGKAGFITGLYVVLVPFLGLFLKHIIHLNNWLGALLAMAGLYLLSITGSFSIQKGDFYLIIGAFFWAVHMHIVGWLSPRTQASKIAAIQFLLCSVLSLITALILEKFNMNDIVNAIIPLCYSGFMSVGVAFTLQVVGQKKAPPTHAAIILSLEAVFAVLGGWIILGEQIALRGKIGCGLMLAGMLLSQLGHFKKRLE